ncbi:MAG TPA: pitrilysin family protein, partial [Thermoanaerobaculia bacterium]
MKQRTLLLSLLSVLLLAGASLAAPPATAAAHAPAPPAAAVPASVADAPLSSHMPFDAAITVGHLPNGMRYYIRKNTRPAERAELWLVVNAGSVLEDPDQRGLAHFIEHLAFASTVHFPKREIVRYLESIGMRFGPDINAQTDFDETIYTLRVPTDKPEIVDKAFDILEDWAHGMAFDPEEVERERGIVIAEWRDGRGAAARIGDRQLPTLLQGSRYSERLPIGTEETLKKATREAIQRFYRDWYRPDLMAVVAVGDFDKAKIQALVEKHFAGIPAAVHPRPRPEFPVPEHKDTRFAITTDPEATTTVVGVYSQHPAANQDSLADYRSTLVETLYNDLLSARLSEISHSPDPPFLAGGASSTLLVRSSRVSSETVGVPQGGIDRGLTALLTEVERVRRFGFTESELQRARQAVLREYEQAAVERDTLESASFAAEYQRNFTEGEPSPGIAYELALVRRFLPEIQLAEINKLSERWNAEGNRVILVAAPEKEGAAPPKEAELRAVFAKVAASKVEPWVDRVQAGPLLAAKPKPGKVVAESRISELDLTEWRLAN